ncbi:MAG: hypothetical protein DMG88_11775 [Acidobacteria bacterium]|nr:MAG: hypothetical protein DMG88_11775 [Acidobacteriota bacterium]
METLFPHPLPCRQEALTIQIEPAHDCDGSRCHQPIFREDGTLNYVAPHSHLIEQHSGGARYHAIFCDFPDEGPRADDILQGARFREVDSIFVNYPPFPENF